MNEEWDFEVQETFNNVCVFEDVLGAPAKFMVRATKDIGDDIFVGVWGGGNTKEEAIEDANKRIAEHEKIWPI